MNINWEKVYEGTIKPQNTGTNASVWFDQSSKVTNSIQKFNKKFDVPIRPVPWSLDFLENVSITLEWLIRDHRHDSFRLNEDKILEHVREFWFHSEYYEGEYAHVCYPQDLLKFRTEYDAAYDQLVNLPACEMSSHALRHRQRLKDLLWYQWKCLGKDGIRNVETGRIDYKYSCDRCQIDMPKSVRMYATLTQGKLKDCIE